jgi:hypothetical protein
VAEMGKNSPSVTPSPNTGSVQRTRSTTGDQTCGGDAKKRAFCLRLIRPVRRLLVAWGCLDSACGSRPDGSTLAAMIVVNSATVTGSGSIGVNYNVSQNVTPPGTPYLCSTTANNC